MLAILSAELDHWQLRRPQTEPAWGPTLDEESQFRWPGVGHGWVKRCQKMSKVSKIPVVYINIFGIEWNWWSSPHRWDSIWIALIHSHLEGCMKVDMFFCPDTNSMVGIVELKHYGGLGQFFGTQGLLVVQHWNGRNIPISGKSWSTCLPWSWPPKAATELQFSIKIMERSDTAASSSLAKWFNGVSSYSLIYWP